MDTLSVRDVEDGVPSLNDPMVLWLYVHGTARAYFGMNRHLQGNSYIT